MNHPLVVSFNKLHKIKVKLTNTASPVEAGSAKANKRQPIPLLVQNKEYVWKALVHRHRCNYFVGNQITLDGNPFKHLQVRGIE